MKRFFACITVLLLLISMTVSSCPVRVEAASKIVTDPTGYTSAVDVKYVTSGKYVANWGARGEDCTFLSTYAQSYYSGSYSFNTMSKNNGGNSQSNAPSSELYNALKAMMVSKHSYIIGYQETRGLYRYTDCLKNDTSHISSFYSGKILNGAWDSGATWNREHTWPNSKGLNGSDENDIMMLRPTWVQENSDRGNKAYGESSGYYDPGVSVRGDCARILLYVYVRWGNTSRMWGSGGVIENLDVLLKWMEEDPVDTWEMGRNDAVQSITGVRNVFVDYPEFAWLLFGEDIPIGMTLPSGNTGSSSGNGSSTDNGDSTGNTNPSGGNGSSTGNGGSTGNTDPSGGNGSSTGNGGFTGNTDPSGGNGSSTGNGDSTGNTDPSGGNVGSGNKPECAHTKLTIKNDREPTCVSEGFDGDYVCSNCGKLIASGQTIPATGIHHFGGWTEVQAATETEVGIWERCCFNCDLVETKQTPSLTIPEDPNLTDPTQTEPVTEKGPEDEQQKSSDVPVLWIIVGATIVVVVGAGIAVVLIRKKSKPIDQHQR